MTGLSSIPVEVGSPGTADRFTIAVMQPYFIPYAGYFRLFAGSELFVIRIFRAKRFHPDPRDGRGPR